MIKECYTLEQAKRYAQTNGYQFICAQECYEYYFNKETQKEELRERKYIVFENIEHYIKNMNQYKNLHEIMYQGNNAMNKLGGKLIFDFDFKIKHCINTYLEPTFEEDIQNCIIDVIKKYYLDINLDKIEFVWLSCKNSKKFSKHLIVKGFYLCEDWSSQLALFYILFKHEAELSHNFDYIVGEELVDYQIARTNGTMRMPLNSKIGGNILTFDHPKYNIYDGLIKLYKPEDIRNEQYISYSDYNLDEMSKVKDSIKHIGKKEYIDDVEIKDDEMKKIYDVFSKYEFSKNFKFGDKTNNIINLIRKKPCECPISNRIHESDNAFLLLIKDKILFYCRRGCITSGNKKFIVLNDVKTEKIDKKLVIDKTKIKDLSFCNTNSAIKIPINGVVDLSDVKMKFK